MVLVWVVNSIGFSALNFHEIQFMFGSSNDHNFEKIKVNKFHFAIISMIGNVANEKRNIEKRKS